MKVDGLEKQRKKIIQSIQELQVDIAGLQATLPAPETVGTELYHIYSKLDEDFSEKTAEVFAETKRSHLAVLSPGKPGEVKGRALARLRVAE